MTAETDDVKLPEGVEALFTSPCFRTVYRGWPVEVAEIEREWMDRLRAEIASALAAEAKAREAAERELRRITRWVGAEPNESAFDAVARCKTAREAAEREVDDWQEREAACCPEDVGFAEYIAALTKRAERAEARVRELEADKERLDWLDAQGGVAIRDSGLASHERASVHTDTKSYVAPTLREALDAARQAGEVK